MTQSGDLPTPHFKDPPVVETVLGVQFAPLKKMRITHYGLLLRSLSQVFADSNERLVNVSEQPPLDPVVEEFGPASGRLHAPRWSVSATTPFPRCWYASKNDEFLVQVQPDRFLFNWRQQPDPSGDYPRYQSIRQRFLAAFEKFSSFADAEAFGPIQPNQCEVTYVNHIPLVKQRNAAGTLDFTLIGWKSETSDGWLPEPEAGEFSAAYVLPEERGRLHIQAQPAVRRDTGEEIIRLTLTARGAPSPADISGIQTWLDLGHEWVVRGFASVTTLEMHQHWERIS